ncbi:MAG: ABC transporter ATP-binding protein [Myxococcota bacterium]
MRVLAGLVAVDEGTVRVLGADPLRQGKRVRESLGLMPQEFSLYGDLTVGENLHFFGRLFCLPRSTYRQRAERLLEITRLTPFIERRADALSGGMYKKLALACALLHEPKVLLLDEPTNGVDPVSRRELWQLLYEFVDEGMTVLVSTAYMDEAERCRRVGLIHEGRLLAEGPPEALVRSLTLEAYEIQGGERARIDAMLAERKEVRAASPAGARLRVVVTPGSRNTIEGLLSPLGATLRPTPIDFEDVFLSRIGSAASTEAGA